MKLFVRVMALTVAILVAAVSVMSCGYDYTEEEVVKAAKKLIKGSYEINVIYFGKGLPISEEESEAAKKFAEENGLSLENVQFLPVTEDSPYFTVEDIKKATNKVYSESYCEYLYKMAFEGYSTEDGYAAVYAKYLEDESGTLTVRIDLADNELPARTYDLDSIKIESKKEAEVVISVVSYLNGEKEDKSVSLTLVKEENGWRLDSPTY